MLKGSLGRGLEMLVARVKPRGSPRFWSEAERAQASEVLRRPSVEARGRRIGLARGQRL
jgi:hypothetical protein